MFSFNRSRKKEKGCKRLRRERKNWSPKGRNDYPCCPGSGTSSTSRSSTTSNRGTLGSKDGLERRYATLRRWRGSRSGIGETDGPRMASNEADDGMSGHAVHWPPCLDVYLSGRGAAQAASKRSHRSPEEEGGHLSGNLEADAGVLMCCQHVHQSFPRESTA